MPYPEFELKVFPITELFKVIDKYTPEPRFE